jgi:hypothetical protein
MQHPQEFRYWENVKKPLFRRARMLGRALGFDPAPPDSVVSTFGAMYYDADPLAEAFVEEVYFTRGMDVGRALLDEALERGVSAMKAPPPSLVALFADIDQDPSWVNHELVELGARTFRRYGSAVFRFAGAITLMAYAENSVAKPLVLTGAYSGASTKHRFLETAAFWIDVTEPFGTRPFARGRAAALRVRIMHVFVRKRLLAHPEWKLDAWGAPISQADALLTLMGGSVGPGLAMQAMGYRPTRREIEAMMHFWRYVGHLMGVRPRWYPANIREGLQLLFMTLVKGAHGAGEDGRTLCQSYADAFRETEARAPLAKLSARIHDGIHRGYTRFFTPPWTYRQMAMPPAGLWALYPLLQFPFIFVAETLRRHIPALEPAADHMARASRKRWLMRHQAGKSAAYRPAQHFTR